MYSSSYIKQLKEVHYDKSRSKGFGGKVKDLGEFNSFMMQWNPKSLLDYGCGKGVILAHLKEKYPNVRIFGYDPAIDMFNIAPAQSVDCVFSNDVLEHIEPEFLVSVLEHINNLSSRYVWLRIDTRPARKILSDGRNAHLILESDTWWTEKINSHISGNIVYKNLNSKGKLDVAIEKG